MTWPAAVIAHFQSRQGWVLHHFLWAQVKPLGGGAPVTVGLWTGPGDETFTIEGQARLYRGAQGGIGIPPARFGTGAQVATKTYTPSLTPEGLALALGHDTLLAPIEEHWGVFHPDTEAPIGFRRMLKGLIDGTQVDTPAQGGQAGLSVDAVSTARRGTLSRVGYKSDESQRLRQGDRINRYSDAKGGDTWMKPG